MSKENMIKIPLEKVEELFQQVYMNSIPIGMGHLHYTSGEMPEEIRKNLMDTWEEKYRDNIEDLEDGEFDHVMTLDYVLGRCCKMYLFQDNCGNIYMRDRWLDHDYNQLQNLCISLDIDFVVHDYGDVALIG